MTWNYRVIEFLDPSNDEPWRAIHEVYYDTHGRPDGYTEGPACVVSSDRDGYTRELSWVIDRMREALGKPVLIEADFNIVGSTTSGEATSAD